jgi:oligopeptide/dipeptide ABC transporter ATP-binding protein
VPSAARPAPLGSSADLPLLRVERLSTVFETPRGPIRAVDDVSLSLARGRTLGIVGESGSGKTVLSRSIMGLLPRRGVSRTGRVLLEGVDLTTLPPKRLREVWGARIGIVLQDPMTSLNPVMKVGRQITEAIHQHRSVSQKEARDAAGQFLGSVGIPDPTRALKLYPHELSGGMRQRVTIAIALACDPALLIADEPTTALDVTVQAQILDLLGALADERGMGLILITHDLSVVAGRTDDTVVMYAGQIMEQGPTEKVWNTPRSPYTEALIRSTPKIDDASHTRLDAIPGRTPVLTELGSGCRFASRCSYAQNRCLTEDPPLLAAGQTDHLSRCWFPVGTPEGRGALAANRQQSRTAAGAGVAGPGGCGVAGPGRSAVVRTRVGDGGGRFTR